MLRYELIVHVGKGPHVVLRIVSDVHVGMDAGLAVGLG